jgi:hypothetical protein
MLAPSLSIQHILYITHKERERVNYLLLLSVGKNKKEVSIQRLSIDRTDITLMMKIIITKKIWVSNPNMIQ